MKEKKAQPKFHNRKRNSRNGLSRKAYDQAKKERLELAKAMPTAENRKKAGMVPTMKPVQKVDKTQFEVEFKLRGTKHVGKNYNAKVWGVDTKEVYSKMVARYGDELNSVDMFDPKTDRVTFEISPRDQVIENLRLAYIRSM